MSAELGRGRYSARHSFANDEVRVTTHSTNEADYKSGREMFEAISRFTMEDPFGRRGVVILRSK